MILRICALTSGHLRIGFLKFIDGLFFDISQMESVIKTLKS